MKTVARLFQYSIRPAEDYHYFRQKCLCKMASKRTVHHPPVIKAKLANESYADQRVIDYLPENTSDPEELVSLIRRRRGGRLLNLDRILLHSPELTEGWNQLFGNLRSDKLSVSRKLRELAICTVAVLNDAEYEFHQHEKPWINAGATPDQIRAIRKVSQPDFERVFFDEEELQVILLTVQMTMNVKTSRDLMMNLRSRFGSKGLVELVGVISGYNMVSRFLVAMEITTKDEKSA